MVASNWLSKRLAAIRTSKQRSGDAAEERALQYLQAQGLRLVERSFLCKGGEIDLLMQDGSCLVFVEVRQRADRRFGGAIASVTAAKQKRMVHAAQVYLQALSSLPPCRFDLVAIEGDQLHWLKNIISA
ncbi:YraN family protein [Undibacterium cyanobacteriorum]|uniref:UPF0102 protein RF679_02160 n=1 Tax=Undibacterium cyanobacteriorum TaxID=3073561 RepID=A0ABY9RIQ2_9BURK|nr:YraN family protein [Undibacterium sp. 20NA77.5]WMW81098.1 YraN family protein [Undibacterium sp. 20NA77.5]